MKKNIKPILSVLVMSLVVFTLTGCRSVTITNNSEATEKKTTEESTKKYTYANDEDDEDEDEDSRYTYDEDEDEEDETTTKKSSSSSNSSTNKNWKSYSGTGYTFELSSDWTKTNNAAAELAFSHLGTASDGFTENINVIVQDLSSYDLDLEGYKELSLQQFEDLGYDLESIKSMTVNGVKGYYCVTSVFQSGVDCKIAQYFTVIDKDAYVFTFASDEDGFDDLEDEVKEIFNTIEFGNVRGA